MQGDRKRTPIPRRDVGVKEPVNGEVKEYRLSEEELAKYRALPAPTDNKKTRIAYLSEQNAVDPEKQRERALKSHQNRPEITGPDKKAFLREIAKGKTIADIERDWGMSRNSLYYWVKKWSLIGINPGKARKLLVPEEADDMGRNLVEVLPKEKYLELRLSGVPRTRIRKDYNIATSAFYKLLDRYGIRETEAEEQALELLQAERKSVGKPMSGPPMPASEEQVDEFMRLQAEVERLKTQNLEVVRLSGEASTKLQAEINRLTDDNKELQRELQEAYDEIKVFVQQVEATVAQQASDPTMTLDQYQLLASRTAVTDWDMISIRLIRNPKLLPLLNFALGAAGEAGEIADEIKKVVFHGHELNLQKLAKEIGDALWYLSQLTRTCGYSFETIAERNIEKLKARYPEGFSEEASQNREYAG